MQTIKETIYELFRTHGWENVDNETALKAAQSVKADTKWNITHLYYWRKMFKQQLAAGAESNGPRPKRKARRRPRTAAKSKGKGSRQATTK